MLLHRQRQKASEAVKNEDALASTDAEEEDALASTDVKNSGAAQHEELPWQAHAILHVSHRYYWVCGSMYIATYYL